MNLLGLGFGYLSAGYGLVLFMLLLRQILKDLIRPREKHVVRNAVDRTFRPELSGRKANGPRYLVR
jgi:hypothetical protein